MAKTPSLRRRRLVGALKRLRHESGLTITQAAEAAGFSPSKLSRIEQFALMITGDDIRNLCEAMDVDRKTTEALALLARQVKRRDWWQVYPDDLLGRFADYLELETDSHSLRNFQIDLIPGLLQTEPYAEAVIRHSFPTEDDETIAQRVKVRMERQERMLHRFEMWFVIDELALRRPIGGAEVMAEQLNHLLGLAREPEITLQILPIDISGHMALGVPFSLIELKDGCYYSYLDTLTGGLYVEDPAEVRRYRNAWDRLSATGLDFDRSAAIIRRLAKQHRSGRHESHLAEVPA